MICYFSAVSPFICVFIARSKLFCFSFTFFFTLSVFTIPSLIMAWNTWMNTQFIVTRFSSSATFTRGRYPWYFKRQSSTYYFNMTTTTVFLLFSLNVHALSITMCVCVIPEENEKNTLKWDSVTNSHKDLRLHFCYKVFLYFWWRHTT